MLGRNLMAMLQRSSLVVAQPVFHVPKRNWSQKGIIISGPPREHVSFGEKMLHGLFMMVVWLTPVAYFLTQIKVWRRLYVED